MVASILVAVLAKTISFGYIEASPLEFAFLSAGLLLGEMLPVTVPRSGGDEQMTLSTSFALALLLTGGLGPAVIVQGSASAIADLVARKPWWRILFNVGQFAISLVAALIVMRLLSAQQIGARHPFTSGELPAVLFGSVAFVVVNAGIVGIAVALHQEAPLGKYFRGDALSVLLTSSPLLFLAPIVIAAAAFSVELLPLFVAPMLAVYYAGRQASRSEHAARHDSLTGLPNRNAFQTAVESAFAADGGPCCVLLMDLDRFKEVNDTLGHGYGDLLLKHVATRLKEEIGDQLVARIGGDEFALLGLGCGREESLRLAQRVACCLRAPFELDEIVLDTQASIGIALFPRHGTDLPALLRRADVAMYQAKQTHTGVAIYEAGYDHHSSAKLALTADLRAAIQGDQITVWYQPELDMRTGVASAVEALVRWEHPELGLLSPASFLEIAEHTNLIKPLTQKVLDTALAQVALWRRSGLDVTVAVNISTRVLIERDFANRVLQTLRRAGVPPTRLRLEVTESALMADPETARSVLQELDRFGIEISIDDFGTGYSSLAYLARLPVSEVKIDRSFVSQMASETSDAIIVSSTIDLAHHLGLRAVAEGIEHLELLPQLRALGCDAVQGYAISRPIPAPEATRWLLDAQLTAPANGRAGQRAA